MSRGTNWPALRAAMTLAGVLIATPALGVLTHRYSFTADGSDSVGSLNWTANGGATFSGGQVTLDGVDDFLSLGATPLPTTAGSSATIEVWGTYSPTTAPGSRIFDFTDTNLPGSTYLYLTPAATPSTPTPATVSSNTRLRFNDGIAENGPTAPGTATGPQVLLTAVIDVTNGLYSLYRDGGLIATAPTAGSDVLGTLGLTSNSHRLGAGQSAPVGGDLPQFLSGSISEFRVYDHVPTAREVLNNAIAGPNALPPTLAAKTWVPAGSGDWNAGGNWSAAGAPAASHRGVIASGGAAVVAGSPDPVGAVQIDNGTLTIGAGATLQSLYPLDLAPGDANTATVNVNAGGRLVTSGILNDGLTGAKTLNVDGGVIEAGFANSIVQVGTTTNVGALGMTLAMGAGGMTWDSALVGAGTIRKTGAGVLNIRGGTTATNNARVDQNPLFTGE
ncbi:MAG TPA: LamG-like jellyroll fold domain-containing protein, partial [Lacipirellulaceae bacterium]|nr:LamG-like jellyroll fold domain-containing protein [Lacipirellulaceae bacterium]